MDSSSGQELQNDLEAEQVKVNSLTHMVVVVDENSGESATAALEEQLQVRRTLNFLSNVFFLVFYYLFLYVLYTLPWLTTKPRHWLHNNSLNFIIMFVDFQ